MNIFVTDLNPVLAAQSLPDKLVVKMPLETAQILSTVSAVLGGEAPYRRTHEHHPCVIWAGERIGNWQWLLEHGYALCHEYTYRYGKTHSCEEVLSEIEEYGAAPAELGTTPFVQAMPEELRGQDPVAAYRRYLRERKRHYAQWKNRPQPTWWRGED